MLLIRRICQACLGSGEVEDYTSTMASTEAVPTKTCNVCDGEGSIETGLFILEEGDKGIPLEKLMESLSEKSKHMILNHKR